MRARGFTLIEMTIVLMIMGIVAAVTASTAKEEAFTRKASMIAGQLKTITGGVTTMISSNFEKLISGQPVTGFADPYHPTIAELRAAGYLANNVKDTNIGGTGFRIEIRKVPAGCTPPACDLTGLVFTDRPFIRSDGKVDTLLAGKVAEIANKESGSNNAGVSLDVSSWVISGPDGTWTTSNPLGAVRGIVAMQTGFGAQGFSQFVRQGDSRPISLGNTLTVAGNTTIGGNATITGMTNASGGASVGGTGLLMNNRNIVGVNNLAVNTANIEKLAGSLEVTTTAVVGSACSPNGRIAKDASGSLISCQSGMWKWVQGEKMRGASISWTSPGIYTWTVPVGTTKIVARIAAEPGTGGETNSGWGIPGGGMTGGTGGVGGYIEREIFVSPGTNITLYVGTYTPGKGGDGGSGWAGGYYNNRTYVDLYIAYPRRYSYGGKGGMGSALVIPSSGSAFVACGGGGGGGFGIGNGSGGGGGGGYGGGGGGGSFYSYIRYKCSRGECLSTITYDAIGNGGGKGGGGHFPGQDGVGNWGKIGSIGFRWYEHVRINRDGSSGNGGNSSMPVGNNVGSGGAGGQAGRLDYWEWVGGYQPWILKSSNGPAGSPGQPSNCTPQQIAEQDGPAVAPAVTVAPSITIWY